MNFSKQKEIVYKALCEHVVHPTAEHLFKIIHKQYPKISKATVYRNLKKMAAEGVVKKIDGLEESAHYDHNIFEHYHFICKSCYKVFDVSNEVAPNLLNQACLETGFVIEKCDIAFSGVCADCNTLLNISKRKED